MEGAFRSLRASLGERALSEFSFSNLYLFREVHEYRYLPGRYPCIAGRTYDGTPHLIALFDLVEVAPEILAILLGPDECFYPVAETTAAALNADLFEMTALREDSDYLFPAAQFIEYAPRSLRAQRTFARQLRERHITQHDLPANARADALQVLERWCAEKGLERDAADAVPCRQALELTGEFQPLQGTLYYIDSEPAGFLLHEALAANTAVVRFAKGLSAFNGIYPYMFQELCRRHAGRVEWLNFEQDLGKPGFRNSKLAYKPAHLLSKFRVRPRRDPASRSDLRAVATRRRGREYGSP